MKPCDEFIDCCYLCDPAGQRNCYECNNSKVVKIEVEETLFKVTFFNEKVSI